MMLTQSCATVDKLCFLHNLNKNSSTLLSSNTSDMKWSAKQTMMVNLSPLFLPTTPLQFVTPQMGRQPSHHYRPSFPLLFAVAAAASLSFLRSFPNQLNLFTFRRGGFAALVLPPVNAWDNCTQPYGCGCGALIFSTTPSCVQNTPLGRK